MYRRNKKEKLNKSTRFFIQNLHHKILLRETRGCLFAHNKAILLFKSIFFFTVATSSVFGDFNSLNESSDRRFFVGRWKNFQLKLMAHRKT